MFNLILNSMRARFGDEEGQTLTEYALILVLIAIVAIIAVTGLGTRIHEIFDTITSSMIS